MVSELSTPMARLQHAFEWDSYLEQKITKLHTIDIPYKQYRQLLSLGAPLRFCANEETGEHIDGKLVKTDYGVLIFLPKITNPDKIKQVMKNYG